MKTQSNKGSVLLAALLISAILLLALAALLRTTYGEYRGATKSYMDTVAFHYAEGGIDRASDAITNSKLSAAPWSNPTANRYTRQDTQSLPPALTVSNLIVIDYNSGTSTYTVNSKATVTNSGGGVVGTRAVQAAFAATGGSSGTPGYALAAKTSISMGSGGANPFIDQGTQTFVRVGSYDSQKNNGKPDWQMDDTGLNFGYLAAVGIQSATDSAISVQNSVVHGKVITGGGNPYKGYLGQNATLVGDNPHDGTPYNPHTVDKNQVQTDFKGDFTSPVIPSLADWSYQSNLVNNEGKPVVTNGKLAIGVPGGKQYVRFTNSCDLNNTNIVVSGPVIFITDSNVNFNQVSVTLATPDATVTWYAKSDLNGLPSPTGYYDPNRYAINMISGRGTFNYNAEGHFIGVINAPNSWVQFGGNGGQSRTANTRNQLCGKVIADTINITNSLDVFYDVRNGGSGSGGTQLTLSSWRQVKPDTVTTTSSGS